MVYELTDYRTSPWADVRLLERFRCHTLGIWERLAYVRLASGSPPLVKRGRELTYMLAWGAFLCHPPEARRPKMALITRS